MKVPLLDLKAQYETVREEIPSVLGEVIESQRFILGPEVVSLEEMVPVYPELTREQRAYVVDSICEYFSK